MTTSIYTRKYNQLSTESFIERSMQTHGNYYDYSKAVYTKRDNRVEIICPVHGPFMKLPELHYGGSGCLDCLKEKKRKESHENLIKKANKIHNNKYDYSKFVYKDNTTKGIIVCPVHGEFPQSLNVHTSQKSGCRKCFDETSRWTCEPKHLDAYDICYLYNIKITGNGEEFYKWGISNDYTYRHDRMLTNTDYTMEIISILIGNRIHCKAIEKKLLNKYKRYQYIPKTKFVGYTECYKK